MAGHNSATIRSYPPATAEIGRVEASVDLSIRLQGRAVKGVTVAFVRELTVEDLGRLQEPRPTAAVPALKKLRESHHALARALAGGCSHADASSITGYGPDRIATLEGDPSFRELVAHYRANLDLAQVTLHDRMVGLSKAFADELRDRLEDKPETFTNRELLGGMRDLADRTGHAPVARSVNINLDLAGRLEAARRRAGLVPTIEGEAA